MKDFKGVLGLSDAEEDKTTLGGLSVWSRKELVGSKLQLDGGKSTRNTDMMLL